MVWTNLTKHTTNWTQELKGYWLLLATEDNTAILSEDGGYLILEQSLKESWTKPTKHTTNWTNLTKH